MVLDIAEEMLVSGAEVSRVTDSIHRICSAYGCKADRTNAFVITSNMQVTIETPEGDIITQIRQVVRNDINYDKLDRLNDLSRYICSEKPGLEAIRESFLKVMKRPQHSRWISLLAAAMIAGGFAVFFGGSLIDGVVSALLGVFIATMGKFLAKYDENQMARVFMTSIAAGLLSIVLVYLGLALFSVPTHIDKIIIGGIMLLIPGIALTNAVRDMLIGDIVTGLLRLTNSLLLAIAIACGFALTLLMLGDAFALRQSSESFTGNSMAIQLAGAFIGSLGFGIFFNLKGRKIPYAGIGGTVTWGVYLMLLTLTGNFISTLVASIFVGVFAEVMARVNRAPATIFLTAAAVPLIPGGALYYTMAGVIMNNPDQIRTSGFICLTTALAISLGFIIVAILNKYYMMARKKA